jgi:hypothetical protein
MAARTAKPFQVYLYEEQLAALRALAERRNVSIAELVRQGVDRLLAEISVEEDPAWDLIGMFEGPGDLAANHDYYLYEEPYAKERERELSAGESQA